MGYIDSKVTSSSTVTVTEDPAPRTVVHTLLKKPETKEVRRVDYQPPDFFIKRTTLVFDLDFEKTQVQSTLEVYRNANGSAHGPLVLDGEDLILNRVSIQLQQSDKSFGPPRTLGLKDVLFDNGNRLVVDAEYLPLQPNEIFKVFIDVSINPAKNTELMGLYKAGQLLCTQCEAEGFRRITYFLDRPDVMSLFTVRLEANKKQFPILLSNGNCVQKGTVEEKPSHHFVVFEDPFPKPAYLFAVVAGDLVAKTALHSRKSPGSPPVRINVWCEPRDSEKLTWALESVKKAMEWDEHRFGREYDLDWFNVVAVPYFNMGAMENKSLNIFNSALLLASGETSTDAEFERILAVVGHEYFHNWTGNRITCRDWFQLTLKEGLTVYRDQEFSSDLGSRAVQRIQNTLVVRSIQFAEDAGPTAHSIRPESYQAVDNFYTTTVYQKGAEVIRMYETLLGRDGFRKGMDEYFARYDGQAVTCDDFRAAMEDANGTELSQFERWYSQAGTPTVTVRSCVYNAEAETVVLRLSQHTNPTPGQPKKLPFHIPIAVGLIGRTSKCEVAPTQILELKLDEQEFIFNAIKEPTVLSILRNFSAPVRLIHQLNLGDLGLLMAYDTDPVNRWDSAQRLLSAAVIDAAKILSAKKDSCVKLSKQELQSIPSLPFITAAFQRALSGDLHTNNVLSGEQLDHTKLEKIYSEIDLSFLALLLEIPSLRTLMNEVNPCDPVIIAAARNCIKEYLGHKLQDLFKTVYGHLTQQLDKEKEYAFSEKAAGKRRLRNTSLSYLCSDETFLHLAENQYKTATNMTDRFSALCVLVNHPGPVVEAALEDFRQRAGDDDLVKDKWLMAQAGADHPSVLDTVKALKSSQDFTITNPNAVRALIGRFAANIPHFHRRDGEGYKFIANCVLELDKINGRIAARVASQLLFSPQLEPCYKSLMRNELERIASFMNISSHVHEIVTKGLKSS